MYITQQTQALPAVNSAAPAPQERNSPTPASSMRDPLDSGLHLRSALRSINHCRIATLTPALKQSWQLISAPVSHAFEGSFRKIEFTVFSNDSIQQVQRRRGAAVKWLSRATQLVSLASLISAGVSLKFPPIALLTLALGVTRFSLKKINAILCKMQITDHLNISEDERRLDWFVKAADLMNPTQVKYIAHGGALFTRTDLLMLAKNKLLAAPTTNQRLIEQIDIRLRQTLSNKAFLRDHDARLALIQAKLQSIFKCTAPPHQATGLIKDPIRIASHEAKKTPFTNGEIIPMRRAKNGMYGVQDYLRHPNYRSQSRGPSMHNIMRNLKANQGGDAKDWAHLLIAKDMHFLAKQENPTALVDHLTAVNTMQNVAHIGITAEQGETLIQETSTTVAGLAIKQMAAGDRQLIDAGKLDQLSQVGQTILYAVQQHIKLHQQSYHVAQPQDLLNKSSDQLYKLICDANPVDI